MASYAALQSSIETAVDQYESYKSQSLRYNFASISLDVPSSPLKAQAQTHAKRSSLSIPALQRLGSTPAADRPRTARMNSSDSQASRASVQSPNPRGEFGAFIQVARHHESSTYLIDLEFLLLVLNFMRSEHPYTSNSLKSAIKDRHVQKKKLWTRYTTQMQGLAKSYTSGQRVPAPGPFDGSDEARGPIKARRQEIAKTLQGMEKDERTCGNSILSALNHYHSQALKDIDVRYSLPDPIQDKVTPVEKHNERVRVFNQLVKFVTEDLKRIERELRMKEGEVGMSKKDKKGSGAADAIESLCIDDYPPYGK